eukprot:5667843-Pleurochrysis_carterae.AAC.1
MGEAILDSGVVESKGGDGDGGSNGGDGGDGGGGGVAKTILKMRTTMRMKSEQQAQQPPMTSLRSLCERSCCVRWSEVFILPIGTAVRTAPPSRA